MLEPKESLRIATHCLREKSPQVRSTDLTALTQSSKMRGSIQRACRWRKQDDRSWEWLSQVPPFSKELTKEHVKRFANAQRYATWKESGEKPGVNWSPSIRTLCILKNLPSPLHTQTYTWNDMPGGQEIFTAEQWKFRIAGFTEFHFVHLSKQREDQRRLTQRTEAAQMTATAAAGTGHSHVVPHFIFRGQLRTSQWEKAQSEGQSRDCKAGGEEASRGGDSDQESHLRTKTGQPTRMMGSHPCSTLYWSWDLWPTPASLLVSET